MGHSTRYRAFRVGGGYYLEVVMRSKATRSRKGVIEIANQNSIHSLIKEMATREEKLSLCKERNPSNYVFGDYQRAWKDYLSYEDNMRFRYIGS